MYSLKRVEGIEVAYEVMVAGQLAASLEVSGWPKPGNVHRTSDFQDVRFEHFLAGSAALGPTLLEAGVRGVEIEVGVRTPSEAGVGELVEKAVLDVNRWHKAGNTHLGVILLFIPIALSAGMTMKAYGEIKPDTLRRNFRTIVESSTCIDAVKLYKAVNLAKPTWTGEVKLNDAPDLKDVEAEKKILEKKITLYDVMKTSARWDNLAREYTTSLQASVEVGYPTFLQTYIETHDVNTATVHTYLKLLEAFPDTFIARKVGLKYTRDIQEAVNLGIEKAKAISAKAGEALKLGGLKTRRGRRALTELDRELRRENLNPGTTADLTASTLMIALLSGLRF